MKNNLLYFLLFISLVACHSKPKGADQTVQKTANGAEDFNDFYAKFHADSVFQVSRIHFPLEGVPSTSEEGYHPGERFYWQSNTWRFQHLPDEKNPGLKRNISSLGDLVVEQLNIEDMFMLERRFILEDGKWYLFYYAALSELSKNKLEDAAKEKIKKTGGDGKPSIHVGN